MKSNTNNNRTQPGGKNLEARIDSYLDGELSSEDACELALDLSAHPHHFDDAAQHDAWLSELRAPVNAPDLAPRVMQRVGGAFPGITGHCGPLRAWTWRVGLAASALLAVMLGLQGYPFQTSASSSMSVALQDDEFAIPGITLVNLDDAANLNGDASSSNAAGLPLLQALQRVASNVPLDESGANDSAEPGPIHAGNPTKKRPTRSSNSHRSHFWFAKGGPKLDPKKPVQPGGDPLPTHAGEPLDESAPESQPNDPAPKPDPDGLQFHFASGLELNPG